jgi:hypothetical protein
MIEMLIKMLLELLIRKINFFFTTSAQEVNSITSSRISQYTQFSFIYIKLEWKLCEHKGVQTLPEYHHQALLLLVEHRASMKSYQALRSPAIPLTSFHDFPEPLISSSTVLRHVLFGLAILLYP